tara:strand:- start:17695 stop:18042 length:348 start_codon:yes stop_codon:yes gene_type:complete
MKHLQTFEQHNNLNEGILDKVNKWRSGYENDGERDDKLVSIQAELDSIQAEVNENPEEWVFNRDHIEAKAKENNYRGSIEKRPGGRDSRTFVIWVNKASGLENLGGAAGRSTQRH